MMDEWLEIMLFLTLPYVASAAGVFTPLWIGLPTIIICAFVWLLAVRKLTE